MIPRIALAGLTMTLLLADASAAPVVAKPVVAKTDPATLAKIRKLQIERRDVLKEALAARREEYLVGRGALADLLKGSKLLLNAAIDAATTAEERIAAHAAQLKTAMETEDITKRRYEAGQVKAADFYEARAFRLEAEIGWLKAGGKEKKEK